MKLNEKSLALFAGSGAPPDKEGTLYKRGGEFNQRFQKRWFVLKGNLLFYFEKRNEKDPVGLIILEGCTIELSDHEDGFTFCIHYPGSDSRTYIIKADSQEDMEDWMKVLSCASYDYMRVCVTELKHQLDDDNSTKKLLQEAVQDRKSLNHSINSWHIPDGGDLELSSEMESQTRDTVTGRRQNPFTREVSEDDGYPERLSVCKARSFQEMHEEYKQEYLEIMEDWRKRQKHLSVARQQVVS